VIDLAPGTLVRRRQPLPSGHVRQVGTVTQEIGSRLVTVQWANGGSSIVAPDTLETLDDKDED
jgi:hypothetical protein